MKDPALDREYPFMLYARERLTDEDLERVAELPNEKLLVMAAELRERRAAGLTAEDRHVLAKVKDERDEALARLKSIEAIETLSRMLGLGEPVRPDIHAKVVRQRDAALFRLAELEKRGEGSR